MSAGYSVNLKSEDTIAATYAECASFLKSRGIPTLDKLKEVLLWVVPELPWPETTDMGHATQNRIIRFSEGFCVNFDAQEIRGYILHLQHPATSMTQKNTDFKSLKLRNPRAKRTVMYGFVSERADIAANLPRAINIVNGSNHDRQTIMVDSVNVSTLTTISGIYFVEITVSAPFDDDEIRKLEGCCEDILSDVISAILGERDAKVDKELVFAHNHDMTVRSTGMAGYWYISGCNPSRKQHPSVIFHPDTLSYYILSDVQLVKNDDFILTDKKKRVAILSRIVSNIDSKLDLVFFENAIDKARTANELADNIARTTHREEVIHYTNTKNEKLRRSRDDIISYNNHENLLAGPFNLLLKSLIVIDNRPDPDLSYLSFDAFIKFYTDCGIDAITVDFDNPRRIADVATFLANNKKNFDDAETCRVYSTERFLVFMAN
jgi:hypothetical protein